MNIRRFLKSNVIAILALGIVSVSISAFTAVKDDTDTYEYQGATFDKASMELASNWSTVNPTTADECEFKTKVTCRITIPKGYENATTHELDGSKAIVNANSQANPSDPTTVASVQSTASGNPVLSLSQVKGNIPSDE